MQNHNRSGHLDILHRRSIVNSFLSFIPIFLNKSKNVHTSFKLNKPSTTYVTKRFEFMCMCLYASSTPQRNSRLQAIVSCVKENLFDKAEN